jgi:hypothetical protein
MEAEDAAQVRASLASRDGKDIVVRCDLIILLLMRILFDRRACRTLCASSRAKCHFFWCGRFHCLICFNAIGVFFVFTSFHPCFFFRIFLFPACYSARTLLSGGRSDYRFASQCNQGGFCWTAFNELLLCKAKFGDDDSKCLARHKNMLSLCPAEWVCAESRAMCLCLSWTFLPQTLHSVMLR